MKINQQEEAVTVIIPTFERVDECISAVQSAYEQTYKPSRIIVIDDGSSEKVISSLSEMLEKFENLTFVKAKRQNHPGRIRNIGINLVTTKWIAFLDSDDLWTPNKLEKQLVFAKKNQARAICTNATIIPQTYLKKMIKILPFSFNLKKLSNSNIIINSSVLIEKKLLIQVGGFAEKFSIRGVEDYSTWLRVASETPWHSLDEPLVYYYNTSPNSIRNESYSDKFSHLYALLDFYSWLVDRKKLNKLKLLNIRLFANLLGKSIGKL